jgi:hypothetical protein
VARNYQQMINTIVTAGGTGDFYLDNDSIQTISSFLEQPKIPKLLENLDSWTPVCKLGDNSPAKEILNNFKKSSSNTQINYDSDGLLDLMIEIKNNAKKLKHEDINIIKKHFELIIMILEEIKKLFL